MISNVLIFGTPADPHVAAVVQELARHGARALILDAVAADVRCAFRPASNAVRLRIGGIAEEFEPDEIEAVWWRRKPTVEQLDGLQFIDREWQYALESLADVLCTSSWVNPRRAELGIRCKPAQLHLAARAGLRVPPTLVSNDPAEIRAFVADCGGTAIYKPVTWFMSRGRTLYTNRIDAAFVDRYAKNIARAPGIFQAYVDKAYELRVTIVASVALAVRIDSQDRGDTQTDWRRNVLALEHRAVRLPADVERSLLAFHEASGLIFGAYDIVVTPDGDHVFLEVNPTGQWLWLETLTKLPITRSLATTLLGLPTETLEREAGEICSTA